MDNLMELRPDLPPLPSRIKTLPVDHRGYPVPWFVQWFHADGSACELPPNHALDHPDFRVVDSRKKNLAVRLRLCWICGGNLGSNLAFAIGPMCAINRISSEPPSHRDCAQFAAMACPFLTKPQVERRMENLPADYRDAPGIMSLRNPGVTLLWITHSYSLLKTGPGRDDYLFKVGHAMETLWFCQGRAATRAEVDASIAGGLPELMRQAALDGEEGTRSAEQAVAEMQELLPTT
jgi:hypothetical protein